MTILNVAPEASKPIASAASSSPSFVTFNAPPEPANSEAPDTSIDNTSASVSVVAPSVTVSVLELSSTGPATATRAPLSTLIAIVVALAVITGASRSVESTFITPLPKASRPGKSMFRLTGKFNNAEPENSGEPKTVPGLSKISRRVMRPLASGSMSVIPSVRLALALPPTIPMSTWPKLPDTLISEADSSTVPLAEASLMKKASKNSPETRSPRASPRVKSKSRAASSSASMSTTRGGPRSKFSLNPIDSMKSTLKVSSPLARSNPRPSSSISEPRP